MAQRKRKSYRWIEEAGQTYLQHTYCSEEFGNKEYVDAVIRPQIKDGKVQLLVEIYYLAKEESRRYIDNLDLDEIRKKVESLVKEEHRKVAKEGCIKYHG